MMKESNPTKLHSENRKHKPPIRLVILVVILVTLLVMIGLFDKPSPVHPEGRLPSILLLVFLVTGLALVVVGIAHGMKGGREE